MESAGGYAALAFTTTGRAVLFLNNGRTATTSGAQARRLVRHRAEEGLPAIPVVPLPEDWVDEPARNPFVDEGEPPELPRSVIAEPLVLWATSGSSLSCERLIPYKDGFEIELLARGPAFEVTEPAPARSFSRGLGRWRGLQPRVRFADGRSRWIEDLTEGDRQDEIVVSPFRRRGSGAGVLWLWVMPLPPDGPVRLEVTWRSCGIERADVEFPGTLLRRG